MGGGSSKSKKKVAPEEKEEDDDARLSIHSLPSTPRVEASLVRASFSASPQQQGRRVSAMDFVVHSALERLTSTATGRVVQTACSDSEYLGSDSKDVDPPHEQRQYYHTIQIPRRASAFGGGPISVSGAGVEETATRRQSTLEVAMSSSPLISRRRYSISGSSTGPSGDAGRNTYHSKPSNVSVDRTHAFVHSPSSTRVCRLFVSLSSHELWWESQFVANQLFPRLKQMCYERGIRFHGYCSEDLPPTEVEREESKRVEHHQQRQQSVGDVVYNSYRALETCVKSSNPPFFISFLSPDVKPATADFGNLVDVHTLKGYNWKEGMSLPEMEVVQGGFRSAVSLSNGVAEKRFNPNAFFCLRSSEVDGMEDPYESVLDSSQDMDTLSTLDSPASSRRFSSFNLNSPMSVGSHQHPSVAQSNARIHRVIKFACNKLPRQVVRYDHETMMDQEGSALLESLVSFMATRLDALFDSNKHLTQSQREGEETDVLSSPHDRRYITTSDQNRAMAALRKDGVNTMTWKLLQQAIFQSSSAGRRGKRGGLPLVLCGQSGSGKGALMAKLVQEVSDLGHGFSALASPATPLASGTATDSTLIIPCFVGASPNLMYLHDILSYLCRCVQRGGFTLPPGNEDLVGLASHFSDLVCRLNYHDSSATSGPTRATKDSNAGMRIDRDNTTKLQRRVILVLHGIEDIAPMPINAWADLNRKKTEVIKANAHAMSKRVRRVSVQANRASHSGIGARNSSAGEAGGLGSGSPEHNLQGHTGWWLPPHIPSCVHLVISATPGSPLFHTLELMFPNFTVIPASPDLLASRQVHPYAEVLGRMTSLVSRQEAQHGLVEPMSVDWSNVKSDECVRSPLWISLCSCLIGLDDGRRLGDVDWVRRWFLKVPLLIEEMLSVVLDKLVSLTGGAASRMLCWIALSKGGLLDHELAALLGQSGGGYEKAGEDTSNFKHIESSWPSFAVRTLDSLLSQSSDGRRYFSHPHVANVVKDKYAIAKHVGASQPLHADASKNSGRSISTASAKDLLTFFQKELSNLVKGTETTTDAVRISEELPFQLCRAQHWEILTKTLTTWRVFSTLISSCQAGMMDLVHYWTCLGPKSVSEAPREYQRMLKRLPAMPPIRKAQAHVSVMSVLYVLVGMNDWDLDLEDDVLDVAAATATTAAGQIGKGMTRSEVRTVTRQIAADAVNIVMIEKSSQTYLPSPVSGHVLLKSCLFEEMKTAQQVHEVFKKAEKASDIIQETLGLTRAAERVELVRLLMRLGVQYMKKNQMTRSRKMFEMSVDLSSKAFNTVYHSTVAKSIDMLAFSFIGLHRYTSAVECLDDSSFLRSRLGNTKCVEVINRSLKVLAAKANAPQQPKDSGTGTNDAPSKKRKVPSADLVVAAGRVYPLRLAILDRDLTDSCVSFLTAISSQKKFKDLVFNMYDSTAEIEESPTGPGLDLMSAFKCITSVASKEKLVLGHNCKEHALWHLKTGYFVRRMIPGTKKGQVDEIQADILDLQKAVGANDAMDEMWNEVTSGELSSSEEESEDDTITFSSRSGDGNIPKEATKVSSTLAPAPPPPEPIRDRATSVLRDSGGSSDVLQDSGGSSDEASDSDESLFEYFDGDDSDSESDGTTSGASAR